MYIMEDLKGVYILNCFVWSYPYLVSLHFGVPLPFHLVTMLPFCFFYYLFIKLL